MIHNDDLEILDDGASWLYCESDAARIGTQPPAIHMTQQMTAKLAPWRDRKLCSSLAPPSQLFPPLLNSNQVMSPLLNSSQLLPAPINSSHRFPPLFTEKFLRAQKLLHRKSFYTQKFLHRRAFIHRPINAFAQTCFETSTQRSIYKEVLPHRSFHTEHDQHVLKWWFGWVVWKSGNWWFCEPGTNLILSNPVNERLTAYFNEQKHKLL